MLHVVGVHRADLVTRGHVARLRRPLLPQVLPCHVRGEGWLAHVNQLFSRLGHIVGQSPYGSESNARTSAPGT
jgi:hypothetical protein